MKKVLIAKPNYKKFSPTGYQMLLDKGYDVVCTDLDRDYFLEELLRMVGDIDGCIANCEPWGEEAMSLEAFDSVLVPAGLEGVVLEGDTKVLMSCLPEREKLAAELGYRAENVAGLVG